MVAPLAVAAASPEVPWGTATLREGAETAPALACIARRVELMPATLDQNRVDVRRPMREHLLARDGPSYEGHITPWEGQHRTPLRGVHPGAQLLTCDRQDGVGARGRGDNRGVPEDEGLEVVRLACGSRTMLASSRCWLRSSLGVR